MPIEGVAFNYHLGGILVDKSIKRSVWWYQIHTRTPMEGSMTTESINPLYLISIGFLVVALYVTYRKFR